MERHVFIQLAYQYATKNFAQHRQRSDQEIEKSVMTYHAINELSHYHHLSKEQQLVLSLAGCFLNHSPEEKCSVFLKSRLEELSRFQQLYYIDSQLILRVGLCMRNGFLQQPSLIEDEILCDAMNYYLSHVSFTNILNQEDSTGKSDYHLSKLAHIESAITRLSTQRYLTSYAQRYFTSGVEQNLQRMYKWIQEQSLVHIRTII